MSEADKFSTGAPLVPASTSGALEIIDETGSSLKPEELITYDFVRIFSKITNGTQLFQFIRFEYNTVVFSPWDETGGESLFRQRDIETIQRLGRDKTGCIALHIRKITAEKNRLTERLERINTKISDFLS